MTGDSTGIGNADGQGGDARFNGPTGIGLDSDGSLVVADTGNFTIRRVTRSGKVTTIAGRAGEPGNQDGAALAARFARPANVAVGPDRSIFVTDEASNTIRRILPDGTVLTYAGIAGPIQASDTAADGPANAAKFNDPFGIAVDSVGAVYVVDRGFELVRRISPDSMVTTVTGPLSGPHSITIDHHGNLAVTTSMLDYSKGGLPGASASILRMTPDGTVVSGIYDSVANVADDVMYITGLGEGVAANPDDSIMFPNWGGRKISKYTWDGQLSFAHPNPALTDLALTPNLYPYASSLPLLAGIAIDGNGTMFVADSADSAILTITPAGSISVLAGANLYISATGPSTKDGPPGTALFAGPTALAIDATGLLRVIDGGALRVIGTDGMTTTPALAQAPAGTPYAFSIPGAMATGPGGTTYVTDAGSLLRIDASGAVTIVSDGTATGYAGSTDPMRFGTNLDGLAVDGTGTIYVADTDGCTVRKVAPSGASTLLAGTMGQCGMLDGPAANALFSAPRGLALDSEQNLYVADSGNHVIRKVTPGGVVSTVAGVPGTAGHADGSGNVASFSAPSDLVADEAGNLYVADLGNLLVRKLTPTGEVSTIAGALGQNGARAGVLPSILSPPLRMAYGKGSLYVTENRAVARIHPLP